VRALLILFLAGCDQQLFFMEADDLADSSSDLAEAPDLAAADLAWTDLAGSDGPPAPIEFISAKNGDLYEGANRFRFVGANRYDVSSFPPGSGKYYCGRGYSDAELDRSLMELTSATGATVLRVWAFQSFTLGGTDFSMLDRTIATAKKYGLRLIFTLENQWKDCTEADPADADGKKSAGWYDTGYKSPLGSYPMSYRDYVIAIVNRYKDEPQIAMWQLMNEAESSDATALYDFVVDMAGVVKFADSQHLLSLGTIGTGQPGTSNNNYKKLHMVAGIDVVEAHDYGHPTLPIPNTNFDSIQKALNDAASLGKPFFIGESGIAVPPDSEADRAQWFDDKIAAHWLAGTDGFLVWSWYDLTTTNWQGWDFDVADPLSAVLLKHAGP
jgi:mannan endo-1,4-beta-mannosidase